MRIAYHATLTAALLLASPACLSEGRHGTTGTTADSTADTRTSGDGAGHGDAAGQPGCPKSCDDGDPCTADSCDAATGTCRHDPAPVSARPAAECEGDADCDDGDPCTADECVDAPDGCDSAWTRCRNLPVPGLCDACQIGGCDDGDPCTRDVCLATGGCTYQAVPDCVTACSSAGVVPIGSVLAVDGETKVGGAVVMGRLASCDDGPECRCDGPLALSDDGEARLDLDGGTDLAWACGTTGCGAPQLSCSPAHAGVAYWAWGRPYGPPEWYPNGLLPLPAAAGLLLDGWCLQTNAAGLVGRYAALLQSDDGTAYAFDASIGLAAGGLHLDVVHVSDCLDCDYEPALPTQSHPIDPGDGFVRARLTVLNPFTGGYDTVAATLYSNHDTLAGRFAVAPAGPPRRDGDQAPDPLPALAGKLSLTRVP